MRQFSKRLFIPFLIPVNQCSLTRLPQINWRGTRPDFFRSTVPKPSCSKFHLSGYANKFGSGTYASNMPLTCFDSEFDLQAYANAQVIPDQDDQATLGKLWVRGALDAAACAKKHKKNGTLIGTAFIAKAVDDDGLLRFWGELLSPLKC